MQLGDSVSKLPQINSKYAPKLEKLNIYTVRDLLTHFPRYHRDKTVVSEIEKLTNEGTFIIRAFATNVSSARIRGGRTIQKATLHDHTGKINVVWFNQPYLVKTLQPEQEFMFEGKVKLQGSKLSFIPNSFEPILEGRELVHLGRVSPQYGLTAGISIKWLRNRIKYLIDNLALITDISDPLADLKIKNYRPLLQSLQDIHFPQAEEDIAAAKESLGLAELTNLQLKLLAKRLKTKKKSGIRLAYDKASIAGFLSNLPFELTNDQHTAIADILDDLGQDTPMHRLLQGDVGSGKTIVAILATLATYNAGYQTAILAPTTVLAEQHFQTFSKFLEGTDAKISLVTGATNTKVPANILIGTSAVLARKTDLIHNLGLVVVDEQHRFGVGQREELLAPFAKDKVYPHFLNMTATPIPRTMALALFGDIEVSSIETKPLGRLPIITKLVPESKREASYDWIREQIASGQQVFWVTPLIEQSEKLELKSAKDVYAHLQEIFPDLRLGLLYGSLKNEEKQNILNSFANKHIDLLVTTSVIEVGIDIPNASVMIIEGAERFGLAQLHQIRGRVGRGTQQSWCFLFMSKDASEEALERLTFFAESSDGLQIAEFDLNNRGPGEVYGTKQAGIPNLKIANLANLQQVRLSRELAQELSKRKIRGISLFEY